MIDDLTIVLQGRCEDEPIKRWIENYSDWNIILSTWVDNHIPFDLPKNWQLIKSEYPERYGNYQNLDYQITSTLNGLNEVKTKYVLKARLDEYWSNLDLVYHKMKSNENKVLCSSLFFRPLGMYPYHISDHIICATTDNLKIMFNGTYDLVIRDIKIMNNPEVLLGCGFVVSKENIDAFEEFKNLHLYSEKYLKKWFHIIDIDELKPYIATRMGKEGRVYYYSDYDGYQSITEL